MCGCARMAALSALRGWMSNGRAPGGHLIQHRAERKEIAPIVHRRARQLLRRHVMDGARDGARLPSARRSSARRRPTPGKCFASPKSSSFTSPPAVRKMLPGVISRWMMPCSCAAPSALAIWLAMSTISSSDNGPASSRDFRLRALEQLHRDERLRFVLADLEDRADVGMIQR